MRSQFLPLEQMNQAELERRYPTPAFQPSSRKSYRQDNYGNSVEIGYDGEPLSSYSPSKLAEHYAITGTSPSYPTMDQAELERRYPTSDYQPTQTTTAMTEDEFERRYPRPAFTPPPEIPTPPEKKLTPPPTPQPEPQIQYNKKGGAIKKAYAAGGTVNSGRPVAMPQGRKPASKPVATNELAGTFKRGGSVTPAQGRLMKANAAENASTMRAAKADNNLKYSKYQKRNGGAC
jgi:hypothetical protein